MSDPGDFRTVLRVDRSPLNPLRWVLSLTCGHDRWLTQRSRPTDVRKVHCERCAEIRRQVLS